MRFWILGYDDNNDPAPAEKTFTQEAVNKIVAERVNRQKADFDKIQSENAQLKELLEQAQNKESMTEEERKQYEDQVTALKQKNETEAQKFERQKAEYTEAMTAQLKSITEESAAWQNHFKTQFINTAIMKHASSSEHEASSPRIMLDLLAHRAEVVLEKDQDGKDIPGKFQTIIKSVPVKEKDEVIEKDLPIADAFKALYNNPDYAYCFKNKQKNGLGGNQNDGNQTPESKMDPNEYVRRHKKRELSHQKRY